jgi:hypothetical protein
MTHHISLEYLSGLRTADLTSMTDEAANEIDALDANHGFEHLRRMTGNFGVEDLFHKKVFHLLQNSIEGTRRGRWRLGSTGCSVRALVKALSRTSEWR